MLMDVLIAEHLRKSYRTRCVVKDVSVRVEGGEIVGLLGPNGAGKTTSFNMIVGVIPSDGGTIHLNDHALHTLPMDRRSRYGLSYLPQDASVFRKLTVEENILGVLELQPNFNNNAARQQRLRELLDEFRIAHLRTQLGASLSGGERRRVEIARALATGPRFLLLDEPFAGIDPIAVNNIQEIIRRLIIQGIGILITDHNVRDALAHCDRTYIVSDGSIIAEGTPETIVTNSAVRKAYLGENFKP